VEHAAVGRDRVAFVVAFKGVFSRASKLVIIVLTLGTSAHRMSLPSWSPRSGGASEHGSAWWSPDNSHACRRTQ